VRMTRGLRKMTKTRRYTPRDEAMPLPIGYAVSCHGDNSCGVQPLRDPATYLRLNSSLRKNLLYQPLAARL
jgi:hypothetical protein